MKKNTRKTRTTGKYSRAKFVPSDIREIAHKMYSSRDPVYSTDDIARYLNETYNIGITTYIVRQLIEIQNKMVGAKELTSLMSQEHRPIFVDSNLEEVPEKKLKTLELIDEALARQYPEDVPEKKPKKLDVSCRMQELIDIEKIIREYETVYSVKWERI